MNDVKIERNVVFSSLLWKTLERVLTEGINFIVQVILARLLLPETFGSLALIVTITTYANIFVQSGLATSIIQKKDLDELDISTVLTASLAIALVCYLLLFFFAPSISRFYQLPELKWALRVLALVLFLNAIYAVENALLSRQMKFQELLKRSMIAIPIAGIVSITMAYMGLGIWSLVALTLTNMFVTVLVLSFGTNIKLKLGFSFTRLKQIYSFGGKILIASIITGSHDAVRTMTIGKIYTSSDLAYYDKAYTYAGYVSNLAKDTIGSVLLPTFSRSQESMTELKKMARTSVSLSAFVMVPVLIGFSIVANSFVSLLLTDKWVGATSFLIIFCYLRIPTVLKNVDFQVYYALGKSEINLVYCAVFCVINIVSLLVSLNFGVLYIAIAATITEYLSYFVVIVMSSKIYGYTVKERIQDLWKTLFGSFVMGVAVKLIGTIPLGTLPLFICQVLVGLTVYLLMSFLIKEKSLFYIISMLNGKSQKNNKP